MKHPPMSDLERIRNGTATADEAAAVGRHVNACEECRRKADRFLDVRAAAAAFDAAFRLDVEEGDLGDDEDAPEAGRRRVDSSRDRWIAFGSAAAAIAAGIVVVLFLVPPSPDGHVAPAPTVRRPIARDPAPPIAPPRPGPSETPARRPEWERLVDEVRRTSTLPFPATLRELSAPDLFRGEEGPGGTGAVWPMATAIDDTRPRLRWPPQAGARYTVTITSEGKPLARSGPLSQPSWRVPSSLERDRMYRWQVAVDGEDGSFIIPAPPAPPAIFRIVSGREHEELVRARSERPDDHLLLGLLHARAGMREDARRALQAAADPLAKALLEQLPPAR